MSSVALAIAVAVMTFASGLLGLALQKRLPEAHLSGGSKDMILAAVSQNGPSSRGDETLGDLHRALRAQAQKSVSRVARQNALGPGSETG